MDSYKHLEDGIKSVPIHIQNQNFQQDRSANIARRKLIIASLFCLTFMIVEIIVGIIANSLSLISDASHLLSDLCSFLISIIAISLSNLKGNHKMSFGYQRAEILGALCSILMIWAITAFLVYAAIKRLQQPVDVDGVLMLITASIGITINIFITYILKVHTHGIGKNHDELHVHNHENHTNETNINKINSDEIHSNKSFSAHEHPNSESLKEQLNPNPDKDYDIPNKLPPNFNKSANLNLRTAYIHAIGDIIQNIGVLIAGILIWLVPNWSKADSICTLIFSILVIYTTWSILIEALNVLMEGSPVGIDTITLHNKLSSIEGVIELHDLHVWSLSVGKPSLACHIVVDDSAYYPEILQMATAICQVEYGILHTTIQIDLNNKKDECYTTAHSKCN